MIGINKVACLMASYNRKNKTLNTLESLYSQSDIDSLALDIFLVDDASNDGTASTVRKIYPDVTVYETTGDKYWSGAMREGMSYLIGKEYDFFLWMNDDVNLDKDAIAKIYKRYLDVSSHSTKMNVVVGCFVDPLSNNVTYSGVKRDKWWNPLRFMVVDCRLFKGEVDTFNANCVLIPRCLVDVVGNIDDSYTHGIGDYDYGLRVHKAGGHIYMTDSPIGTCSRNKEGDELWHKGGMTLRQRFSCINTPKGVPYKERYIYYRRHAGIFWFLFFVVPYIKIIISHYKNKLI